jgi:TPR repeat protein
MSDTGYPAAAVELRERALTAQREDRWAEATDLFREAFEAGHPLAAYELGLGLFDRGADAEATEWCRRAAEQGVAAAAFEVGFVHQRAGELTEAERWYRRAADGGHVDGALNLGNLLKKRGERAEAIEAYERAWEGGSEKAAFNLGYMYDDGGNGDLAAAAEWYERAASKGDARATHNLGSVRGDQGDTAAQNELWRRAAELGHPKSAYALGATSLRRGEHDTGVAWLRQAVVRHRSRPAAGLLAEFFDRHGEPAEARFWRTFLTGLEVHSPAFDRFASEVAVETILRQRLLDTTVGASGAVRFDIDARTWTSSAGTYQGLTSLGSFSYLSRTWLWAWANKHFAADHPAILPTAAIRAYGEEHDIPELSAGELELSGFPNPKQAATSIALAAATLLGGNGIGACSIDDGKGVAYFHIDDPALPTPQYDPLSAPGLVMAATEAFPAHHEWVVRGYVKRFGTRIQIGPQVISGEFPGGHRLTVGFTENGLVKAISSENGRSGRSVA